MLFAVKRDTIYLLADHGTCANAQKCAKGLGLTARETVSD